MNPRVRLLPLLFFTLAAASAGVAAAQSAAQSAPRDLFAAASDEGVFVARVEKSDKTQTDLPPERTILLMRRLGGDARWRRLITLSRRVISLAARGEDAVVLFDNGDWMTVWDGGNPFGPPLENAHLLAVAGDHTTLWAIGVPNPPTTAPTTMATELPSGPGTIAATAPIAGATTAPIASFATTQATTQATTMAATQAAVPPGPAMYRFAGNQWFRVADLPAELASQNPSDLSLTVVGHQPMLTIAAGRSNLRTWAWEVNHWSERGAVEPSAPAQDFRVIEAGLPPTLWFTTGGPGILTHLSAGAAVGETGATTGGTTADATGANGVADKSLAADGSAPGDSRSATLAAETLRVFSASSGHLYEQAYNRDGTPLGKRAELVADLIGADSPLQNWLAPTVTVVFTMLLLNAARRRQSVLPAGLESTGVALAPLGLRFAAGVIDALPVLLSLAYFSRQIWGGQSSDEVVSNQQMLQDSMPFCIMAVAYVIYTCIAELLTRQTIGKWLFGLRVVALDGARPNSSAVVIRNLLRLVDVLLMAIPLALVLFSPLRQRLGDVAAGTVVVRKAVSAEEAL